MYWNWRFRVYMLCVRLFLAKTKNAKTARRGIFATGMYCFASVPCIMPVLISHRMELGKSVYKTFDRLLNDFPPLPVVNDQHGRQLNEQCPNCGAELGRVHCMFICPNCGFRTDCSDLQ